MPTVITRGAASAQGYGFAARSTAANYIEDVFSTYLYTGTGSAQTITNGIDLSGKGGMVWIKSRSAATNNFLFDTVRGTTDELNSNTTDAEASLANSLTAFNADGFSISSATGIGVNSATYASWTFRKQAKFFDVVTYTGNGSASRNISHNLGSVPGCIIAKPTSTSGSWGVYHRSTGADGLYLNGTNSAGVTLVPTNHTSTTFEVANGYGLDNVNGVTYVAYLFAHDAGGFGATGSDNVISCGSFTTGGDSTATINLGWEPQWVLVKGTGSIEPWNIVDNVRGWVDRGSPSSLNTCQLLIANTSGAEQGSGSGSTRLGRPLSTGFSWFGEASTSFIYIAIRRGPMKTPTSGTSVFGLSARSGTNANATVTGGQISDAILVKNRGSAVADLLAARLTGSVTVDATSSGYLVTSTTAGETEAGTTILQANAWDVMDGVKVGTTSTITNASSNTFINYLFRRAPGFFDVVCYTGDGTLTPISHNLAVSPDLVIVKRRSSANGWYVSQYLSSPSYGKFETTAAFVSQGSSYPVTSTTFVPVANTSGQTFVAYLFATCPGVSKVGSYTGTGTTKQIDCGFTGGARFVLIKRTDSTGDWYVWDTARGIVSGNDPYLLLNSTAAEVTNTDYIDTYSAGFEISSTAPAAINANGGSFIFLAIA